MATQIPSFFFLDGVLYKKLSVIRSENILVAWSFPREQRMHFNYQQTKRNYQQAFKIKEVAQLLDRKAKDIKSMMSRKIISYPSGTSYTIATRRPADVYWSEDDVLELRNELYALAPKNKYGEPYYGFNLISEAELRHKMRGGETYYIQDEKGNFVKVWRAL